MADDTMGHETSGTAPVEDRTDGPIIDKPMSGPVPLADHGPALGKTDWTASDARGPLNEAPPVPHATHGDEPVQDDVPASPLHPATATQQPAATVAGSPPRRSIIPVVAAVLVGALIGAGSAYFVYQWQSPANNGLDDKLAQLSARVDSLDKRPDPQQAIAALKSSVATLEGKVASLQKTAPTALVASAETAATPSTAPTATSYPASVPSSKATAPQSSATAPQASANTPQAVTTAPQAPASAPPAAATPAFDPAPLQQKIAALQATIDGLQKQGADAKALQAKVGDMQTSLDGLKTQTADVQKQTLEVQKQTSDVQKQASGAEAGIAAIQGQQKSFEGRISAPALAVVADSLVQAIDQGQPYAQQVEALVTLGADPARIAILRENARKGVPSAQALATQFAPLAEPILATAHKVAPDASVLDRLKSGMSSLVSVRSTSDTTGDGLEARVSRIEADLTHDDITGAFNTWNALPADAKAKSDAWGALAKTSTEAIDAARALQQGAIASLGGHKS